MIRIARASGALLVLTAAATVWAQDSASGETTNADQVGDVSATSTEGSAVGVKLTDGVFLRPYASLATAYQSNVFFQDSDDLGGVVDSPLLRIGVGTGIETEPKGRMEAVGPEGEPPTRRVAFRGDFNLTWNQYLSGNDAVMDQSDLGAGALVDAKFNPDGAFTFLLRDGYIRSVVPPQTISSEDVNRHKNELTLGALIKPGGGAIQGYASYTW